MTNEAATVTNTLTKVAQESVSVWEQYAGEIIVTVVSAALIAVGSIYWKHFGKPLLVSRINERKDKERLDRLVSAFGEDADFSADMINDRRGVQYGISINLTNPTTEPVTIRSIHLVIGGHHYAELVPYSSWFNDDASNEIPPQATARFSFFCSKISGINLRDDLNVEIVFQYASETAEYKAHTMHLPPENQEALKTVAAVWLKYFQRVDKPSRG